MPGLTNENEKLSLALKFTIDIMPIGVVFSFMEPLPFLLLDSFEGGANISAAIKSGSTVPSKSIVTTDSC